jgi:hypothetical protein
LLAVFAASACNDVDIAFDAEDPAKGPGELVGSNAPLNDGFAGGVSSEPNAIEGAVLPADDALPDCGNACRDYCDGLNLANPLDRGACSSLWGVGLTTQPIDTTEACRRLFVDLIGRFPTRREVDDTCGSGNWSEVAADLIGRDEFVQLNQRRWADLLLYNNEAVNLERIYDMDELVAKLYQGRVAYDEFTAVLSAHPVLTRRHGTPGDRAEALFTLFLGRPPYEQERSDMGRLYVLWDNGYYDHPKLGLRLPDAVIEYRCVDEFGRVDPSTQGECTSVSWGHHRLVLEPDFRSQDGEMWSGLLTPDEWEQLQLPGRIVTSLLGFWEHAVTTVLEQYLDYDLGAQVPAVREELVSYFLEHQGDLRALHYAVVTSQLYLQSTTGVTPTTHRWTYGPLKQVEVEPWIDTIKRTTGYDLSTCDHRIPDPDQLLRAGFNGRAIVEASHWELNDEGRLIGDYRDLARTLGGCPENEVGGRFKTVSILTTATQEAFVTEVCNPTLERREGVDIDALLPDGMDAEHQLDEAAADAILAHQAGLFLGRKPTAEDVAAAHMGVEQCAPKPCTTAMFARPLCYALLSSSEMLFY